MKNKKSVTKFVFALSVGFQNGMSWPHCTKTHKLVRFLGNGPFPDQGPVGGAHGASSPTQQYDFFAEQTLKILVYFMQRIKSYSIFTFRQTHILHPYMHGQDFFLYGNLYLSQHYVSEWASLTHSLRLWRIIEIPFWQLCTTGTYFIIHNYTIRKFSFGRVSELHIT